MFRKSMKRRVLVAGATLGAVVAGGSAVALATASSGPNVYQACLTRQGALYNVHANPAHPLNCRQGGSVISWNQTGPAGAPGARGATGATGAQGPAGAQGPQGAAGANGGTGPQGPTGPQGQQGTAGTNGTTVLNGTTAPASTLGTLGDFYLNTAGHTLYGPKTASGWGNPTSLVGPQGPQGTQGSQGAQGPAGASPVVSVTTQDYPVNIPGGDEATLGELCPSGDVATGGGGGFTNPSGGGAGLFVVDDMPIPSGANGSSSVGWRMIVLNNTAVQQSFDLYLVCMETSTQSSAAQAHVAARPAPTVHLSRIKR